LVCYLLFTASSIRDTNCGLLGRAVAPKSIICLTFYTEDQEYMKCYVKDLWWDYCELQITLNGEKIHAKFKCNKK